MIKKAKINTLRESFYAELRDETGVLYSEAVPLMKYDFNSIKKGSEVVVLDDDDGNYYYIPFNLFIPFIEGTRIDFGEGSGIFKDEDDGEMHIQNEVSDISITSNSFDQYFATPESNFALEAELAESQGTFTTKIYIPEIEEGVDYKYNVLQLEFYASEEDELSTASSQRVIVDFHYDSEDTSKSYFEIGRPFTERISVEEWGKIEVKVFEYSIEFMRQQRGFHFRTGNGYSFSLTERENEGFTSGWKLKTPSSYFVSHDNTVVEKDGELTLYDDRFLEYKSFNYKQMWEGDKTKEKHSEMEDHEHRRPYVFGIYNKDYVDVETEERVRDQGVVFQTPKHLFKVIDSSGVGDDLTAMEEGYWLYSSLDGNYIKFISNSFLKSALEIRTKEGHRVNFDESLMAFEQFKYYDKDEKTLMEADKPVNFIKMDKTEDAEMLTIESHRASGDYADYEKIFNKFVFSETSDMAGWLLQSTNDKSFAEYQQQAGGDKAQIIISNSSDGKILNKIFLDATSSDGTMMLTNEFASGKKNEITMTKDMISVQNADGKTKVEITPDGVKLETDKDVKMKAANFELDGKITLKTGDAAPWQPNIIPNCLFTGAPHGGSGGGIANLKGG